MTREKRQFTAEDRATVLRRHLADKVPVSDLCDEYKIQPSLFYTWQRQLMENMGTALEDRRTRRVHLAAVDRHHRSLADTDRNGPSRRSCRVSE